MTNNLFLVGLNLNFIYLIIRPALQLFFSFDFRKQMMSFSCIVSLVHWYRASIYMTCILTFYFADFVSKVGWSSKLWRKIKHCRNVYTRHVMKEMEVFSTIYLKKSIWRREWENNFIAIYFNFSIFKTSVCKSNF